MKTELRIYHTHEALMKDFNKLVKQIASLCDEVKVIGHGEIIIANVTRLVFKLDRFENAAGYRADRIFIDELVDPEIADYAKAHVSHKTLRKDQKRYE
jgi:hypothetical protein